MAGITIPDHPHARSLGVLACLDVPSCSFSLQSHLKRADDGYTLVEVVVSLAIMAVALMIVFTALSGNILNVRLLSQGDTRLAVAEQVLEDIKSQTIRDGSIPDSYEATQGTEQESDTAGYSYIVDIEKPFGSQDLAAVRVRAFKTGEGVDNCVTLTTVVRVTTSG